MTTRLTMNDLLLRTVPPVPWTEGDCIPWDDPEFSQRMLREHLSQHHDLASRRATTIERQVAWLHGTLLGGQPSHILDLACGPGLYVHRLAALGHECVGIDFGPASIRHAREVADAVGIGCDLRLGDIRTASFENGNFDLVTLLYGQINVFRREEAKALLARARVALRPGGTLVLEPQTEAAVRGDGSPSTAWSTAESGLFSPRPHLLLHERFWDEPTRSTTDRWHVVDVSETDGVTRHAQTTAAWTDAELTEAIRTAGFSAVERLDGVGEEATPGLFALVARA